MNNKKILTISLVTLGLAGAGFGVYWYLRKKSKKVVEETETNNNNTTNVIIGASRNDDFPLKKGSKGERVKLLQTFINEMIKVKKLPLKPITADGDFGKTTEERLFDVLGIKEVNRTQWNEAATTYEKLTGKKLPFIF